MDDSGLAVCSVDSCFDDRDGVHRIVYKRVALGFVSEVLAYKLCSLPSITRFVSCIIQYSSRHDSQSI
jgi:hypothetical protein